MSEAAVPVSRRARVSPWGQLEIESNPSAGGPNPDARYPEITARKRTLAACGTL